MPPVRLPTDLPLMDMSGLPFWAEITELNETGPITLYSWVEKQPVSTTTWADMVAGRSGDTSNTPAYEPNNKLLQVGDIVRCVRAYWDPDLGPDPGCWVYAVYEGSSAAGGGSGSGGHGIVAINEDYTTHQFLACLDGSVSIEDEGNGVHLFSIAAAKTGGPCKTLVTNVCLLPGSGGGPPNISVEYVVACFPKGTTFTPPFCIVDPTGCCGSGSGSGGGHWWCVSYSLCDDFDCEDCEDPVGEVCELVPEFAMVGDSRCVAQGEGVYRYEIAIRGPFNTEAECAVFCSYVLTSCCLNPIAQDLCVTLVNADVWPCDPVTFVISYIGLVEFGLDLVPCWEGTGYFCDAHPITVRLICNLTAWSVTVTFPDECQADESPRAIPLIACDPFRLGNAPGDEVFLVSFEPTCTGIGGGSNATLTITTAPCPGDDCPVTVTPTNTGYCPDDVTLQVTGTCFEFDPDCSGNTVVLQDSAGDDISFSIDSCTETELILSVDLTAVPIGPITATVANGNGNSGGLVQVGTLTNCGPCAPVTTLVATGSTLGSTLTIPLTDLGAGLMVVYVAKIGGSPVADESWITFDGLSPGEQLPYTLAPDLPLAPSGGTKTFIGYKLIPSALTGICNIVLEDETAEGFMAVVSLTAGLPFGEVDVGNKTVASGFAPGIPPYCPPSASSFACEVAASCFLLTNFGGTVLWSEGFTNLDNLALTVDGVDYLLTAGYLHLVNAGEFQIPQLAATTPDTWTGLGQGSH